MSPGALLGRVGLVVAGLLVGSLGAELLARAVRPASHADLLFNSPDASPLGLYVVDPHLLMVPSPGFSAEVRSLDYRVPVRINEAGVRGDRVVPGGWLAVGDSFTLSVQVIEAETFSGRLAEHTGVQVHNAGVDGYSTWQALRRYEQLDDRLQTEGVLLTFFLGNDFQDNERFPHVLSRSEHLVAGSPIPRQPTPALEGLLLRHSHLYAHYRIWRRQQLLTRGEDPMQVGWRDELSIFSRQGTDRLARLVGSTEQALQQLATTVRKRGDRLVVAIAPPAFVVDTARVEATFGVVGLDPEEADLAAPGRVLAGILARLGVEACDLAPALEAGATDAEPLYFTFDGHWTPAGHAIVAAAVADCLEAE